MQKRQWYTLGYMFSVFLLVTAIWLASPLSETISLLLSYFLILWVIATITCFICGSLEKE
ncbi:hypothetical protein C5S32_10175 [ANME-1 cluster archaeon GoMg1]|nr:hypothetical protein [ANME-1 cluster archaeon GoMg1]